jgi:hypothetical protein
VAVAALKIWWERPMPDADHYLRQANILLSMSLGISNPVVASQLVQLARDYLATAIKLRADDGLPPVPRSPEPASDPRRHGLAIMTRRRSAVDVG